MARKNLGGDQKPGAVRSRTLDINVAENDRFLPRGEVVGVVKAGIGAWDEGGGHLTLVVTVFGCGQWEFLGFAALAICDRFQACALLSNCRNIAPCSYVTNFFAWLAASAGWAPACCAFAAASMLL